MIKYVRGDLLETSLNIIAHSCNAQGVMGSGVAKAIRDKYPEVYDKYKQTCKSDMQLQYLYESDTKLLGKIDAVLVDTDKFVINIYGQNEYLPRNVRHTNYEALSRAFQTIKEEFPDEDIAMPKIGCGLGGGDWKVVSAIIESVFDDRDVYIYEL
jgi:O-acetyl-ADP-ribose deacetylase (regulator of RNase III)